MIKRLQHHEIVFTRSLGLIISLVTLFIGLNVCLFLSLKNCIEYSANVLEYVSSSLQYALFCFVYFLFSSYELSSKLIRTEAIERISAVKGELLKVFISQFLILLFPVIIVCFSVSFWYIYAFHSYDLLTTQSICNALLAVVLYYFLPACIAILSGIAISTQKRAFAYTFIILLTIAVSPLPLRYFSAFKLGPVSAANLLDWFNLSVPDADWISDSIYGIPIEFARWVLNLFWIVLLSFCILLKCRYNFKKKSTSIIIAFLAVFFLVLGVRFANRHNDSIIYKDSRPDGLQNNLRNYYNESLPNEAQASFSVKMYTIDLRIQSNLKAKVKMTIENNESQNSLNFTLHHGLNVDKVCDNEGNELDYCRDRDYLIIYTNKSEISISYSGQLGKYYSNYQAIYLPGYTAFYPIPGTYHLWNSDQNKIKPLYNNSESYFELKVHSKKEVYSNLEQVSKNTFCGVSNSMGVFSGLMSCLEKEGVRYFESILSNDSMNWNVSAFDNTWKEYCDLLGITRNISLEEKLIVFHPAIILGFYPSDNFVDDGKTIYFGDRTPRPETLAYNYAVHDLVSTSKNQFLYSWFTGRIYSLKGKTEFSTEKPDYSSLVVFNKDTRDFTEEDWMLLGPELEIFGQLMSYQENKLGSKVFLSNIYQYLQKPDSEQGVLDFIYYMGES